MRIADICSRNFEYIDLNASACEAAGKMCETQAATLLVVDDASGARKPVGILTDRDLVRKVMAKGAASQAARVGDVMTRDVAFCGAGESLFDAARTMRRYGVRRLPVLGSDNRVVGLVSADDIYSALAKHMHELSEALLREQLHELESSG